MDHEQHIRRLRSRLDSLCQRARVATSADDQGIPLQAVKVIGDRDLDAVEYMQPAGMYFRPPAGAEGLVLSPLGDMSGAVLICASKRDASPGGTSIAEGEGGLHYAGTFKVFLNADGTVSLGDRLLATDFVALASLVDAELSRIKSDLDAIVAAISSGFTAVGVGTAANGGTGKTAFEAGLTSPAVPADVPTDPNGTGSEVIRCQ